MGALAQSPALNELAIAARRGDKQAREELGALAVGFAKTLVATNALFLRWGSPEDLQQEALVGFCEALRDWDPAQQNFTAFVWMCMRRNMQEAIRVKGRLKHQILDWAYRPDTSLDDGDGWEKLGLGGPCQDPALAYEHTEAAAEIKAVIQAAHLTCLERICLWQVCLLDRPYHAVTARYGFPHKRVDNALQRARTKLKACIGGRSCGSLWS